MNLDRGALTADIVEQMALMRRFSACKLPEGACKNMPTKAQMGILFALAHDQSLNLKNIAEHLRITPSAVTQLVDGLVADKLISREEDAGDRRKTSLTLTELGKEKLHQVKKAHVESFTQMLEPLTDEELLQWRDLQRKIIQNLK